VKVLILGCVVLGLAVMGCDSESDGPAATDTTASGEVSMFCSGGGRDSAQACTRGSLLGSDGAPVVGVRVTACTAATCITGTSDASGHFDITGLPVEPHKLEVLGFIKGFYSAVYFVDMIGGTFVEPMAPIRLHPLPDTMVTGFVPETGGTLTLAGGDLEIVAPPSGLTFPIGTAAEGAEATSVDLATLPDYDINPWVGREAGAFAYIIHPFPLKSDGTVAVGLRAPAGVTEAASYRLYTVHTSTARIEDAGLLARDVDGLWRVEDPSALHHVSILIAVPEPQL